MTFLFLKHSELDETTIRKIIALKSQHWPFSYEEQLDWFSKNLKTNDLHLLLFDDNRILRAYLNMIELNALIDDKIQLNYGIGNVCVDKVNKKKGLGLLMMQIVNYYLKQNSAQGLLLCKHNLVPFYEKANWTLFQGTFLIDGKSMDVSLLSFYTIQNNEIIIDKNF